MPDQRPTNDTDAAARQPVPDLDLRKAGQGRARGRRDVLLVAAVSAGGATGAAARYLIEVVWPTTAGSFPIATLVINVLGCALIGVLMVLMTEVWGGHRLISLFLGTGVLGGFTTFSTYSVEIQQLVAGRHTGVALIYLVLTPVAALTAVWVTTKAARSLVNWRIQ
ncbi:MAG: fluoride efflux transporter CrcB [Dermatophilaceae bacterium]